MKTKYLQHRLFTALTAMSVCLCQCGAACADSEPLKGAVSEFGAEESKSDHLKPIEPMPAPVLPKKKLEGNIDHSVKKPLEGEAEDEDIDLQSMPARTDGRKNTLQGSAKMEGGDLQAQDPDADDMELSVEWDRWRNRFLTAVQMGVQESLNSPEEADLRFDPSRGVVMHRFPLGTVAWFYCKITHDRRITNLKIMESSGFPNYDKAVYAAVRNLEGSAILKYPKRSRRTVVSQHAGIKTSDKSDRQYFKFGDVERIRVPAP